MKISLIQSDIIWEDKSGNLARLDRLLEDIPHETDAVFLPEMFNTGFSMNPEELYEVYGSTTTQWLFRAAEKTGAAIGGSFIIKENDGYFNRWYFVTPEREIYSYDKRHLFSPAGENKFFTKGSERIVFEYKGLRICPNICYDLRFPVWSRCRNDYDILVNSANWPEKRNDVWMTLLKARALENQCYAAGVNRIGIDGEGNLYSGDSVIFDPYGKATALGRSKKECIVSADISTDVVRNFRRKFPVQDDADSFSIKLP